MGGGSDGGGGAPERQTQVQEMDPAIRPYVTYGLSEAQRQYQAGGPDYFPGQTYVGPSQTTQAGLQAAQTRALMGNPLVPQAQQALGQTISGEMLGPNPYLQAAFAPAARAAQQTYFDSMSGIGSRASQAGRYGSGSMQDLENRAMGQFATSLADKAGQLAYDNYSAERARQMAAIGAAPGMAEADYGDIQRLLTVGQAQEAYQGQALQDAINRYNYEQNLPAAQLQQFLSAAYGAPMGGITTTMVPTYSNPTANLLGGAAAGYALAPQGYQGLGALGGAALGGLLG
jgi:hypothetical protein